MLVTVTSNTKKTTQYGAVMHTVTIENPNGNLQYFQLAPWNYKAAGLDGVMINAERAVVNGKYDITFKSATIKGRKVTLLTKFSKASNVEEFSWDDEEAPVEQPKVVVEEPKVIVPPKTFDSFKVAPRQRSVSKTVVETKHTVKASKFKVDTGTPSPKPVVETTKPVVKVSVVEESDFIDDELNEYDCPF